MTMMRAKLFWFAAAATVFLTPAFAQNDLKSSGASSSIRRYFDFDEPPASSILPNPPAAAGTGRPYLRSFGPVRHLGAESSSYGSGDINGALHDQPGSGGGGDADASDRPDDGDRGAPGEQPPTRADNTPPRPGTPNPGRHDPSPRGGGAGGAVDCRRLSNHDCEQARLNDQLHGDVPDGSLPPSMLAPGTNAKGRPPVRNGSQQAGVSGQSARSGTGAGNGQQAGVSGQGARNGAGAGAGQQAGVSGQGAHSGAGAGTGQQAGVSGQGARSGAGAGAGAGAGQQAGVSGQGARNGAGAGAGQQAGVSGQGARNGTGAGTGQQAGVNGQGARNGTGAGTGQQAGVNGQGAHSGTGAGTGQQAGVSGQGARNGAGAGTGQQAGVNGQGAHAGANGQGSRNGTGASSQMGANGQGGRTGTGGNPQGGANGQTGRGGSGQGGSVSLANAGPSVRGNFGSGSGGGTTAGGSGSSGGNGSTAGGMTAGGSGSLGGNGSTAGGTTAGGNGASGGNGSTGGGTTAGGNGASGGNDSAGGGMTAGGSGSSGGNGSAGGGSSGGAGSSAGGGGNPSGGGGGSSAGSRAASIAASLGSAMASLGSMTQSMGSIASAPPTARGDFGSGSSSPQASSPPPQQSPSAGSGSEHSSQSDSPPAQTAQNPDGGRGDGDSGRPITGGPQQTDPSQPPATTPDTQQAATPATPATPPAAPSTTTPPASSPDSQPAQTAQNPDGGRGDGDSGRPITGGPQQTDPSQPPATTPDTQQAATPATPPASASTPTPPASQPPVSDAAQLANQASQVNTAQAMEDMQAIKSGQTTFDRLSPDRQANLQKATELADRYGDLVDKQVQKFDAIAAETKELNAEIKKDADHNRNMVLLTGAGAFVHYAGDAIADFAIAAKIPGAAAWGSYWKTVGGATTSVMDTIESRDKIFDSHRTDTPSAAPPGAVGPQGGGAGGGGDSSPRAPPGVDDYSTGAKNVLELADNGIKAGPDIREQYHAIKNNGLIPDKDESMSPLERGASGANAVTEGVSTYDAAQKGEYLDAATHAIKTVGAIGGAAGNSKLKEKAEAISETIENLSKAEAMARDGDTPGAIEYGLQGIGSAVKVVNKDVGSGIGNSGKAFGVAHGVYQTNSEINVLEERMNHSVDPVNARSSKYKDLQNLRRLRAELLRLQNPEIRMP